ncbi:MAG: hypothetical protein H6811_02255 [Phycisphaeraceae bacterium]|nr:hypothetical protein [Phycisphaeraceae bacterium]
MGGYLDPYRRAVEAFGASFESLLWNSPYTQEVRFEAIAASVDLADRSVGDFGAGRADLLDWLASRDIRTRRYVAVEAIPELHAMCQRRAASFGAGALAERADFVQEEGVFERLIAAHGLDTLLFSGSLNTLSRDGAVGVLERAWGALSGIDRGVLAFNFLSTLRRAGSDETPACRFDTMAMIRWAIGRTPLVVIRHDYLADHDCTIVMRRHAGVPSARHGEHHRPSAQ